jgi:hypothetical protein
MEKTDAKGVITYEMAAEKALSVSASPFLTLTRLVVSIPKRGSTLKLET